MLIENNLPHEPAMEYISASLEAGGALSSHILNYIKNNSRSISISSYTSKTTPLKNASDFRTGGVLEKENIHKYIYDSLDDNLVVIIDDVMANKNDVNPNDCSIEVHDSEIYHIVHGNKKNLDDIKAKVLASSVPWHQMSVILRFKRKPKSGYFVKNIISSSPGEKFDIVEIILGAFDGEGYIHIKPNKDGII